MTGGRVFAAGERIGGYRIEALAGRGAMAMVYRARQLRPERVVALKVILPEYSDDAGFRARFERESSLAALIEHPNVLPIYEVSEQDGVLFIAMRYVDGGDLSALLRREGPIAAAEAVRIVTQVAGALGAAHAHGLVHRDVKPGNILLTGGTADGHLYLTDFGLSKRLSESQSMTRVGAFVGTLDYVAPEQAMGSRIDARADVYALGCVLYELLAGTVPFPRESEVAKIFAHVSDEPRPIDEVARGLPPAMSGVVARSMAKDPDERFRSVDEFASAAQAALDRHAVLKPVPTVAADLNRLEQAENARPAGWDGQRRHDVGSVPVAQISSFIGRECELVELQALFGAARLVTLTGAGGVGKTRLALRLGAEVSDGSEDGVWFVELAPVSDPTLVGTTVADALRVREQPGCALIDTLADALHDRRLLVVLDNCEHVVAAAAVLVEGLLRRCECLSVLATSRQPLGIAGEHVYRVPSLSVPEESNEDQASLAESEAVRLFVERAAAQRSGFALDRENAAIIARVCRRLDGIPLAIELATARLGSLSIKDLDARLDRGFQLLTGGARTALPRQQTLQALIDWSYRLLSQTEQTVLARLSVFARGCDLEAAETVGAGVGVERLEVLDPIAGLVDKSVVQTDDSGGAIRYRLLETVREYAAAKLTEGGEDERTATRRAHRDHYLALAELAEPYVHGSEQLRWLERLDTEHDNLRAALSFCAADPDPDPGLRLGAALGEFSRIRSHVGEAVDALTAQLDRPDAQHPTPVRCRALASCATLLSEFGDYPGAIARAEASLEIARAEADDRLTAHALHALAMGRAKQGDPAAALALADEGVVIARRVGDPDLEGNLHRGRSFSLDELERHAEARAALEESLRFYRQAGDRIGAARSHNILGVFEITAGNLGAAVEHIRESLAVARELGDSLGMFSASVNLGLAACLNGDSARARLWFADTLKDARRSGALSIVAYALFGLALTTTDDAQTAATLHGAVDALFDQHGAGLEALESRLRDTAQVQLRATLGQATFEMSYQAGRVLHTDDAITLALSAD